MGLETLIVMAVVFVVTAASTAYQIIQQKKAAKAAAKAADARKGFEIVTEGNPDFLPKAYGRVKVGGVRVWHSTSSNFTYVATNANKSYLTGRGSQPGFTSTGNFFSGILGNLVSSEIEYTVTAYSGGYLNSSMQGDRNEFMFFQQAICQAPINRVVEPIIEGRFISDASLGTYGEIEMGKKNNPSGVKAALRLDYFYKGGVADTIIKANHGSRKDATFDNIAFLSAVIRLDRDNPQFSGVPGIQTLIEGSLVRTVTGGVLSSLVPYDTNPAGWVYSNNPAWCLLDYLLDPLCGKGLDLDEINLPSFEAVAALCAQIVQTNVAVGGKFYQPTDGATSATRRDIPLYECNMFIDPKKPIRENIESLLTTMGDCRLVWSAGQYKLNMQYPESNDDIISELELNDDNLILEQNVEVQWPSAQDRLNFCTVRFHNEHELFGEDSVSWPPQEDATYIKGIGGFKYGLGISNRSKTNAAARLEGSYHVWNGSTNTTEMFFMLIVPKEQAGTYRLDFMANDTGTCQIALWDTPGTVLYSTTGSEDVVGVVNGMVLGNAGYDMVYRVRCTGTVAVSHEHRAVSAKISNANSLLWTTRDTSYTSYINVVRTKDLYEEFLAEDNGMELEEEIFAEGITDPYHAMAKAEEIVRTSRSASTFKLKYQVTDRYPEPGDFLRVNSPTLKLGDVVPLYTRMDSSKIVDETIAELSLTRFDYRQLAWNVKDDESSNPPDLYEDILYWPSLVWYEPALDPYIESSGRVVWNDAEYGAFAAYIVYMHRMGLDAVDEYGYPIFHEIGRTQNTYFDLPAIGAASAFFGVRTITSTGRLSDMQTTDLTVAVDLTHSWSRFVELTADAYSFLTDEFGVTTPATITIETFTLGFVTPEFKWYLDGVLIPGETDETLTVAAFSGVNSKRFTVRVNELGDTRENSDSLLITHLTEGSSAINGILTNELHSLPADSTGAVLSYSGASTAMNIYAGSTNVTSSFGFSVSGDGNPQGLTYNIVTNVLTVTAGFDVGETVAKIKMRAEGVVPPYVGIVIEKEMTITKTIAGEAGAAANSFMLISDLQTIKYDTSNVLVPGQTVTLTGQKGPTTVGSTIIRLSRINSDGSFTAIDAGVYLTGSGTITPDTPDANSFTQTGNTVTLTGTNFNTAISGGHLGVVVEETCQSITDKISILRVRDGAQGTTGPQGPAIIITPSAAGIKYVGGVETPASQIVTLTATLQGISGTINWSTSPNVKTGTGSSFTLNSTEMGSNAQIVVTATVGAITASQAVVRLGDWTATPPPPTITSPTAPTNPVVGTIWIDNSVAGVETRYRWTGTMWQFISTVGSPPPVVFITDPADSTLGTYRGGGGYIIRNHIEFGASNYVQLQ